MRLGVKELFSISLDTVSIVPTNLNLELLLISSFGVFSTGIFFSSFSSLSLSFSTGFSSAANSAGFSSSRSLGELVSSSTVADSFAFGFSEVSLGFPAGEVSVFVFRVSSGFGLEACSSSEVGFDVLVTPLFLNKGDSFKYSDNGVFVVTPLKVFNHQSVNDLISELSILISWDLVWSFSKVAISFNLGVSLIIVAVVERCVRVYKSLANKYLWSLLYLSRSVSTNT